MVCGQDSKLCSVICIACWTAGSSDEEGRHHGIAVQLTEPRRRHDTQPVAGNQQQAAGSAGGYTAQEHQTQGLIHTHNSAFVHIFIVVVTRNEQTLLEESKRKIIPLFKIFSPSPVQQLRI